MTVEVFARRTFQPQFLCLSHPVKPIFGLLFEVGDPAAIHLYECNAQFRKPIKGPAPEEFQHALWCIVEARSSRKLCAHESRRLRIEGRMDVEREARGSDRCEQEVGIGIDLVCPMRTAEHDGSADTTKLHRPLILGDGTLYIRCRKDRDPRKPVCA